MIDEITCRHGRPLHQDCPVCDEEDGQEGIPIAASVIDRLQHDLAPSPELDDLISDALGVERHQIAWSSDYGASIEYIEGEGIDWIMASVNGLVGGTPWACAGVPQDQASYAATPLMSLWLSYFKFRSKPAALYAAGFYNEDGSYGMFAGPSPDPLEILGIVPPRDSDRPAYVLRMGGPAEGDDVERMYRWRGDRAWMPLRRKR